MANTNSKWSESMVAHRGTIAAQSIRTQEGGLLMAQVRFGDVLNRAKGVMTRAELVEAICTRDESLRRVLDKDKSRWSQWAKVARVYLGKFDDGKLKAVGDMRVLYDWADEPERIIANPDLGRKEPESSAKPPSDRTILSIDRELCERLKAAAERDGSTTDDLIARMLNAREGRVAKPRARQAVSA